MKAVRLRPHGEPDEVSFGSQTDTEGFDIGDSFAINGWAGAPACQTA
jgi:hypothetical protein